MKSVSDFEVGDRVYNIFCDVRPKTTKAEMYKESFKDNLGTITKIVKKNGPGVWVRFDRSFPQGNPGPFETNKGIKCFFFFAEDRDSIDDLRFLKKAYKWKKL